MKNNLKLTVTSPTEKTASRKRLRKGDTAILERLQHTLRRDDCDNMAGRISDEMFEAHRGAMEDDYSGLIYVFGNDGFKKDIRSRLEVAKLVKTLDDAKFKIVAFGLAEGGYTWALEVDADWDYLELLDAAVWDAWFRACEEVAGATFHPFPNRLAEMLAGVA